VVIPPASRSPFGIGTLIAFVIAQFCDGLLTYVGVHTFGQSIEANPILSWYIAALGAGAALLGAKALAIACALLLYRFAHYRTICALTVLYFAMAVQPWVSLLLLAH
jgi:arginine exporter protein ArgO